MCLYLTIYLRKKVFFFSFPYTLYFICHSNFNFNEQGDQLCMAVCFWYLVKRDVYAPVCSSVQ